jgi:hypothetical protein
VHGYNSPDVTGRISLKIIKKEHWKVKQMNEVVNELVTVRIRKANKNKK